LMRKSTSVDVATDLFIGSPDVPVGARDWSC
jgi:hypothetical protein